MENVKFALPQWAIDAAVEGLKDLARTQPVKLNRYFALISTGLVWRRNM